MSRDPRDVFRGALIVAGRDLRANSRGFKVWIICGLTLLAVLAAAFGISGLGAGGPSLATQYALWSTASYPANNSSAGIVVWVSDYLGNPDPGQVVVLGRANLTNGSFIERTRATTNVTGWASFPNLGNGSWPLRLTEGALKIPGGVQIASQRPTENLSVTLRQFDLIGDGAGRDVSLQAMWSDGTPAEGAQVKINGGSSTVTDANGFHHERFADGTWVITVSYRGETFASGLTIQRSPLAIIPYLQGPDALLLFLGVALLGIIVPIIAIAMSYDAVAKERMQGSLELLLSRPASRTGVAVGKFLGSFLSVGLPMLGVLLGVVVGVAAATGKFPDSVFVVAFMIGTLGLIAAYVLIMQIFSTLAKSPGNAILAAIVVWLVFNLVWSLVVTGVQTAFHIETGTPAYFSLYTATSLFNPTLVFELFVAPFVPASSLGLFGTSVGGSIPDWTGPVAMAVWIVALLVLAIVVFRRRIV